MSHASPTSSEGSKKQRMERDDEDVMHRDPSYFQYYSQLQHQQNMLQDYVRTSTYHSAITQNSASVFNGQLAMDVGAGSGILSFFAIQAGARHVYAVEASGVAEKLRKMAQQPAYAGRITVVGRKVEDPQAAAIIPQVDVIVSEPIGVLLVHERMIESFIYARDHFLRPGGAMLPSSGTIQLAPLSDAALWNETLTKARFWQQRSFYNVDLNPYFEAAFDELFSAPVVGCFSPNTLMATEESTAQHIVDFATVTMDQLRNFDIPLQWNMRFTGLMHGIAGWFDLAFAPPSLQSGVPAVSSYMSTGPHAPATHWQQIRLLLRQPLAVNAGQVVRGIMRMRINDHRSYDMDAEIICLDADESARVNSMAALLALMKSHPTRVRSGKWYLQEQIYNYSYTGEPLDQPAKPETANLYLPVNALLAESSTQVTSVAPVDPNLPTDFVIGTKSQTTNQDQIMRQ
ncbi:hypothetical protein LPJ78_001971 [Coemansia sp. RSA 989]|nr:S-adenosyl-L-methionine-dependent methyltransferase [Coemansia mojavensis]KAJ1752420.1 hypothetical protein LPJ79_001283 [Coemansia sp. RSA 1821]KAJ1866242.1 hypothetical protein LPJ78_001971 [Coemansia sp. RSA 989]KAJ1874422.1 hypothetical protein LPJ55_001542 [Coemansia sp. RSA 990]KAJ2630271.1 hypothetical protein H4R22_002787 [Coemansia sp. RSA 1290]KAJ2650040.1 hypothetical protein IWW40_002753 [Coemansia sp. RSA 1250]KAJ2672870.1 hypothetical protein IWW42_002644 [Coemansia sp. RSA 1